MLRPHFPCSHTRSCCLPRNRWVFCHFALSWVECSRQQVLHSSHLQHWGWTCFVIIPGPSCQQSCSSEKLPCPDVTSIPLYRCSTSSRSCTLQGAPMIAWSNATPCVSAHKACMVPAGCPNNSTEQCIRGPHRGVPQLTHFSHDCKGLWLLQL